MVWLFISFDVWMIDSIHVLTELLILFVQILLLYLWRFSFIKWRIFLDWLCLFFNRYSWVILKSNNMVWIDFWLCFVPFNASYLLARSWYFHLNFYILWNHRLLNLIVSEGIIDYGIFFLVFDCWVILDTNFF